jgi:hypothetical protein
MRDPNRSAQLAGPLLVDGHVHLHRCFDRRLFLDSAAAAFARAAAVLGAAGCSACLLFTESARDDAFDALRDEGAGPWMARPSVETESFVLQRDDDARLLVIAGRQMVTREGLEVLALGTVARHADGAPIAEVIGWCQSVGAFPVIPWGFGKWTLARGRIVDGLLAAADGPRFALGDNGGRPRGGRRPRLFAQAEGRGIAVLPGTDPLPFPDEARRVGSYCFVVEDWRESERPAAALIARLAALRHSPQAVGQRVSLPRFARLQIAMQARKRLREAA